MTGRALSLDGNTDVGGIPEGVKCCREDAEERAEAADIAREVAEAAKATAEQELAQSKEELRWAS